MNGKALLDVLRTAGARWNQHNAPRLGAALAYYSLLSVAPLVVVLVAIVGLVFSRNAAEKHLLREVSDVAGQSTANIVKALLESAHRSSGLAATAVAVLTLLFGASGVFVELRDSLNTIWEAPDRLSSGIRAIVVQRLASFGMVLALGFLLLVSLLFSAGVGILERFATGILPPQFAVLSQVANFGVSFLVTSLLFALIFKFVPNVPIRWKEVAVGAVSTAVLFDVGKAVLAVYLSTAGVGSTYGAAGSLIAFVVWVYYSSQIFFFGAVFTRGYADRFGSRSAKTERERVRRQTPEVSQTQTA